MTCAEETQSHVYKMYGVNARTVPPVILPLITVQSGSITTKRGGLLKIQRHPVTFAINATSIRLEARGLSGLQSP